MGTAILKKHPESIIDRLRNPVLTVADKRKLVSDPAISGREREHTVYHLRETAENWDKEDCARIEAVRVLKSIDMETAATLSLELAGNKTNSILLRCNAIAFFVKNRQSCSRAVIEDAANLFCKTAADENEPHAVRQQAADAFAIM
ncbi:hypothetical protein H0O02_01500 [Candidatus Micrarchaeota archaeon]|nr:hypothetical protein [Candidatus Micrarchaeota archaeon]